MEHQYEEWWYNSILKGYKRVRGTSKLETIWLHKKLKKLMFLLDSTNDINLVKNSMILLISLIDDFPIDIHEQLGREIKSCTPEEQKEVKKILKETLLKQNINI